MRKKGSVALTTSVSIWKALLMMLTTGRLATPLVPT
jgi:hypothetical protein